MITNKQVVLVELNYEVTPIHIREHLSSKRSEVELHMKSALEGDVFVIATCHRFSILAYVANNQELIQPLISLIPEIQYSHFMVRNGEHAVSHWFGTTCGLNSRTIGEHEILGQVRTTFSSSKDLGAELNELVKRAIHAGKRARTETQIGRHAISLTSIVRNRIRARYPDTTNICVLVSGTGKMSRLVLEMLKGLKVQKIIVASKERRRAESLCTEPNMFPLVLSDFSSKLNDVNVAIGATWTESYLLQFNEVFGNSNQLFIDLGMPRNFDPRIGELPLAELVDLSNLNETVEGSKRKRNDEVIHVEAIIDQEVREFNNWLKIRRLIPEIRNVRAEVDLLRDRCCLRINEELFYLNSQEKNLLCYQVRGLTQQHFTRIVEVLKSDKTNSQKITENLEILGSLYASVDENWHDSFVYGESSRSTF